MFFSGKTEITVRSISFLHIIIIYARYFEFSMNVQKCNIVKTEDNIRKANCA